MSNNGKKFNIIDLFILLGIILVAASALIQGIAVKRFEESNVIDNTVITLRLLNVDDTIFEEIEKGDYVFSSGFSGEDSIGIVEQKLKHSLSNDRNTDETDVGEIVEYEIQILSKTLRSNSGFYTLYDQKIIPGMRFSADNGYIGFECEVISVKGTD